MKFYSSFKNLKFLPNVFFLFQGPIQDSHYVCLLCNLTLFLAYNTFFRLPLYLTNLIVLGNMAQEFCSVSLTSNLSDFLKNNQTVWEKGPKGVKCPFYYIFIKLIHCQQDLPVLMIHVAEVCLSGFSTVKLVFLSLFHILLFKISHHVQPTLTEQESFKLFRYEKLLSKCFPNTRLKPVCC